MLTGLLTQRNLTRYWQPEKAWGHSIVLGPMFAIHEARRNHRLEGRAETAFRWEWTDARGVEEALLVIWNMTGRWQARRAVSLEREELERVVLDVVPRLARLFNRHGTTSLWVLQRQEAATYDTVVQAVHEAVTQISRLRATRQVEPVLGSKVLHHFFPSVVPVFDTALIRRGVMKLSEVRASLEDGGAGRKRANFSPAGAAMIEYHDYFATCANLGNANQNTIAALRSRFARGFRHAAPVSMVSNRRSMLWCLDAKIAEYCLIGEAFRQKLIDRVRFQ